MAKIEELAKEFTDELFSGDDLTDLDTQTQKNDAYVLCMAFGNHVMSMPLADRLTEDEIAAIRNIYAETYPRDIDHDIVNIMIENVLTNIFGEELFKDI